jgi:hypothetical protein
MMVPKNIRTLASDIICHFSEINTHGLGWHYADEQCIDIGDFLIIISLN